MGNPIVGSQETGVYFSKLCFIITEICGILKNYRSTAPRMTLKPHAPIFKPTNCPRIFTVYRTELLTEMDASTSQDIFDLIFPAKYPKTFSDSWSLTVSEQLHLLTTRVNQLRITMNKCTGTNQTPDSNFPVGQHKTIPVSSGSSTPSGSVL